MHDRLAGARLLAVAHGTASEAGRATVTDLVDGITRARPSVPVELCFLDVAHPRLSDALDERPTVLVPLLLSTGYHVQTDIPAAIRPYPDTVAARHLGPHPRLVDALVDRLPAVPGAHNVLVGAGSSRTDARNELDETAALLAERLGARVDVLTMADDLSSEFGRRPRPLRVATYLLAEGRFTESLAAAACDAGGVSVAAPLGVHPSLVELVWARFDETAGGIASGTVR